MKTRRQYLNKEISHQEYYAQFVTPGLIEAVKNSIGEKRIKESKDEHFNDIPLGMWDKIFFLFNADKIKEAGDYSSLSFKVCATKAAATIIREED